MDDGGDAVLVDGLAHQRAVAGRAGDERHRARNEEAEAGRQIVEHDHALAGVDECVHHMAADIAGAAGHQDRHDLPFNWRRKPSNGQPANDWLGRPASGHG